MNRRIARLLTARPWLWVLLCLLLTAFFAWRSLGLSIQEELLDYWPEDDPDLVFLRETLAQFGLEGGAVLGLEFDGPVFTRENLKRIRRWTEALARVEGVTGVLSLTNVSTVHGSSEGIEVAPLVPEDLPETGRGLEALEHSARQDPDLAGRLLSADGKATALFVAYPDEMVYAEEIRIGQALYDVLEAEQAVNPDVRFHPTGVPAFLYVFRGLTLRELRVLYPAVVACMILILWVSFRNLRALLVPLAVVGIATIWTLGMLELSGRFLNSATIVIPAVVVVIAVADTIHIINQYFESVRRAGPDLGPEDRRPLMAATLERVLFPCFLTTVTTVTGFLSLLLVDVPIVQDVGVYVSFGILSAFLASVALVPATYLIGPLPSPKVTALQVRGWIGRFLGAVMHLVVRRPLLVGLVSAAVFLFGLTGVLRLQVDFRWKEFVKEGHRVREAIRFLDARLGGYDWLTVVLEVPEGVDGDFLDPEKLRVAARVQAAMEAEPFVGHVDSVVNPLRLANRSFHGGDAAFDRIPHRRDLAAQYMLLFELGGSEVLDGVISFDRRTTQISARLVSPGHRQVRAWKERLAPWVQDLAAEAGVRARISGFAAIFSDLNLTITYGLVWSLAGALAVISVILTLALGSLRLGLAAMIPNTIPVLATLGFMGWARIDLSGQTAMMGCIGIGIAVDDTIHILHRFHRELEASRGDRRRAVEAAIQSTGRAVTFTSVVLLAGFSVLVLSAFVQYTLFGVLCAVTMLSALLGDLFLLPVMLLSIPWLTEPEARAATALPAGGTSPG